MNSQPSTLPSLLKCGRTESSSSRDKRQSNPNRKFCLYYSNDDYKILVMKIWKY
jgi:hypothetical protein